MLQMRIRILDILDGGQTSSEGSLNTIDAAIGTEQEKQLKVWLETMLDKEDAANSLPSSGKTKEILSKDRMSPRTESLEENEYAAGLQSELGSAETNHEHQEQETAVDGLANAQSSISNSPSSDSSLETPTPANNRPPTFDLFASSLGDAVAKASNNNEDGATSSEDDLPATLRPDDPYEQDVSLVDIHDLSVVVDHGHSHILPTFSITSSDDAPALPNEAAHQKYSVTGQAGETPDAKKVHDTHDNQDTQHVQDTQGIHVTRNTQETQIPQNTSDMQEKYPSIPSKTFSGDADSNTADIQGQNSGQEQQIQPLYNSLPEKRNISSTNPSPTVSQPSLGRSLFSRSPQDVKNIMQSPFTTDEGKWSSTSNMPDSLDEIDTDNTWQKVVSKKSKGKAA